MENIKDNPVYGSYTRQQILAFISENIANYNLDEGLKWAKFLSAYGDGYGDYELCNLYLLWKFRNIDKALKSFKLAYEKGVEAVADSFCEYNKNYNKEEYIYFKFLHYCIYQSGYNEDIYYKLGECYKDGIGCERNEYLARYWLGKGSEDFIRERCLGNPLCMKALYIWEDGSRSRYESLLFLHKALEQNVVCAKAMIGKLAYCIPYLHYLYNNFEYKFFLNLGWSYLDVNLFRCSRPFEWPDNIDIREKKRIQDYGLLLIKEAASEGDYSAQLTLHRIEINDGTLPYMLSPFQP